jgi:hypothetical protein
MTPPETPQTRSNDRSTGWIGGAVLLVIAAALFAEEFGLAIPGSLWGILLFIPAIAIGLAAFRTAQQDGTSPGTFAQGAVAVAFAIFGIAILAGINLGLIWPILLVLIGISAIVRAQARRS